MNEKCALQAGFRLRWMGCACFEMDFGGMTVVSDPYITDNKRHSLTWEDIEHCDLIVVSHTHHDHTPDIPLLMEKFGARLLCGDMAAPLFLKWLDCNPMSIYPLAPNVELDFGPVKIKALFGQHLRLEGKASERRAAAEKAEYTHGDSTLIELALLGDLEYRNYLYTLPNGLRMLVWGNDLSLPEQRNFLREIHPDIAVLQMTKNSGADTAQICREMGCRIVVPHHFDYPNPDRYYPKVLELQDQLAQTAPEIRFVFPEYGKWIDM